MSKRKQIEYNFVQLEALLIDFIKCAKVLAFIKTYEQFESAGNYYALFLKKWSFLKKGRTKIIPYQTTLCLLLCHSFLHLPKKELQKMSIQKIISNNGRKIFFNPDGSVEKEL